MKTVLKLSGKVIEKQELIRSLARQVADLRSLGFQLVLVHGGGKQLTAHCERLGVKSLVLQGRRVTDKATLEAAKMVFGAINRNLTAGLLAEGVRAVGMSAFDGYLTRSRRRPPLWLSEHAETVDFGYVAEIEEVDSSIIEALWQAGCVPVVSCLCADEQGQVLNINADTLAARVALALGAERLISVSDVEGIYTNPSDPSTLLPSLDLESARYYLESGVIVDGMVPKVENAIDMLELGLPSFQILSGMKADGVVNGVLRDGGTLMSGRTKSDH
jgi:acetylglutamate kinase